MFGGWRSSNRFHSIREQLQSVGKGQIANECSAIQGNMLAVSLGEGWRGEICHVAATDERGQFAFYKVVDPSFHNGGLD